MISGDQEYASTYTPFEKKVKRIQISPLDPTPGTDENKVPRLEIIDLTTDVDFVETPRLPRRGILKRRKIHKTPTRTVTFDVIDVETFFGGNEIFL